MATRLAFKKCKSCHQVFPNTKDYFKVLVPENIYNEYGKCIRYNRFSSMCITNGCYQKDNARRWQLAVARQKKKTELINKLSYTDAWLYVGTYYYYESEDELLQLQKELEDIKNLSFDKLSIYEQAFYEHAETRKNDNGGNSSTELTIGYIRSIGTSTEECIRGTKIPQRFTKR